MQLYIAEKPDLARAIADAIDGVQEKNNGYIKIGNTYITWCFGHLLRFKNPEELNPSYKKWNLEDLPLNLENMALTPIDGKENQVKIIAKLLKDASLIVNAGDPDEEGQLLVDELLEYLENTTPVKRILINDNTKASVKKALENLKDNKDFQGLRNSAYARAMADFKYGINLTRGFTVKANNGSVLSIGRVQTPILGLVYNREMLVKQHVKQMYYNLTSTEGFKLEIPENQLEKGLCLNKDYLENIQAFCNTNNQFKIVKVSINNENLAPPLPFNLLKLQAEAFRLYKYKPDVVQNITQTLREKHKAITYNRSDCQYLSDEHYAQRGDIIKSINNNISMFKDYKIDNNLKSKAFNNANITAHHGIIPTVNDVNFSSLTN